LEQEVDLIHEIVIHGLEIQILGVAAKDVLDFGVELLDFAAQPRKHQVSALIGHRRILNHINYAIVRQLQDTLVHKFVQFVKQSVSNPQPFSARQLPKVRDRHSPPANTRFDSNNEYRLACVVVIRVKPDPWRTAISVIGFVPAIPNSFGRLTKVPQQGSVRQRLILREFTHGVELVAAPSNQLDYLLGVVNGLKLIVNHVLDYASRHGARRHQLVIAFQHPPLLRGRGSVRQNVLLILQLHNLVGFVDGFDSEPTRNEELASALQASHSSTIRFNLVEFVESSLSARLKLITPPATAAKGFLMSNVGEQATNIRR